MCFYILRIRLLPSKLTFSIHEMHSLLQAELFDKFLNGSSLEECYSAVAAVANRWLDLLDVCKTLLGVFLSSKIWSSIIIFYSFI